MNESALTVTKPTPPTPKPSVLDKLAQQYNTSRADLLSTLKETCFKGATDAQMISLCIVAGQYNLNPFLKEIYAFPAKGGGIVPVVGVDGWAKLMNSRPEFDGIEFEFAGELEGDGPDLGCTATVWIKNRAKPVRITEYFSECARQTEPWKTCPRRMLRHKALIQAARIAFGFSGIHDPEEAETISVHAEPVTISTGRTINAPTTISRAEGTADAGDGGAGSAAHEGGTASGAPTGAADSWNEPNRRLEALVTGAGLTFADLVAWGEATGNIPDPTSLGSFADIAPTVASRLMRAGKGLVAQLQARRTPPVA